MQMRDRCWLLGPRVYAVADRTPVECRMRCAHTRTAFGHWGWAQHRSRGGVQSLFRDLE